MDRTMSEERYRAQPLARYPLGGGVELVYVAATRTARLVSTAEAESLSNWHEFEGLADRLTREAELGPRLPGRRPEEALTSSGTLLEWSAVLRHAVRLPSDCPFSPGI